MEIFINSKVNKKGNYDFLEKFLVFWLALSIFLDAISFISFLYPQFYLSVGIILGCIISFVNGSILKINRTSVVLSVAFILLLAIGLSYTHAPNYGTSKALAFTAWALMFLFAVNSINRHLLTFIKINLFFTIFFLIILFTKFGGPITFLQNSFSQGIRLGISETRNGSQEIFNPIWCARYLAFDFLVILFVFTKKGLKGAFFFILEGIIIIYLIATGSRGPMFALLFSILILLIRWVKKKSKRIIIGIGLLFFCFLFFAYYYNSFSMFPNAELIQRFSLENESSYQRLYFEKRIFRNINAQNFLWGNGTGESGFILTNSDSREYPHNIFLEIFFENGLIGFSLLLLIIVDSALSFKYIDIKKRYLFLSLWFFFFLNAQLSGDIIANQYFFFIWLLIKTYKYRITKTFQKDI